MNNIIYNIIEFIKLGIIIFIIDIIWINIYMGPHFRKLIFNIQNEEMNIKIIPAFISYFFLIFALYYFIIKKNNKKNIDIFLLGLSIYGVFEATNMALFTKWDIKTFILDSLWGGILYVISYNLYRKL